MKIAVLGAGNGGQAIAGYLGMHGYTVALYDRNPDKIQHLLNLGGITLTGKINGFGRVDLFTTKIENAIAGAAIIMVATTANAHQSIADEIAKNASDNQIFILNPGRTCGALVFKQTLLKSGFSKHIYIAEAQTLIYACRVVEQGVVNIIGVKDEVLLAAVPSSDTKHVIGVINPIFPCFTSTTNVLRTSLENIGAIFHPCVMLFNIGTIERKTEFYFYRDMTERVAKFIEAFDEERLAVGKAYKINLLGVNEWIKFAYKDTRGDTLCERMKNNPGYHDIKSPSSIFIRQLTEDIPTGVLPMMEFGKAAGLKMKLFESMIDICESLLGMDFHANGRTLKNLGLDKMSKDEIIEYINQ